MLRLSNTASSSRTPEDGAVAPPASLYHYTSVEVLALILHYKTLRLRRLDLTDDPLESETADLGRAGRYVVASSWSASPDENLQMWSAYTRNKGVRIKLAANPFVAPFELVPEDLPPFLTLSEQPTYSGIPAAQVLTPGHLIVPMHPQLVAVEYTDDESELRQRIVNRTESSFWVNLGAVGRRKLTHWEYQQEWRYVLQVYPMTLEIYRDLETGVIDDLGQRFDEAVSAGVTPDIEFIDLPIDPSLLNGMEVTLGPTLPEGQRIIVETLLQRFAATARIIPSKYDGKIR